MNAPFELAHRCEIVARLDGVWITLSDRHARDLLSDLTAEALAYDRAGDLRAQTTARNALALARAIRAQEQRRWRAERTQALGRSHA